MEKVKKNPMETPKKIGAMLNRYWENLRRAPKEGKKSYNALHINAAFVARWRNRMSIKSGYFKKYLRVDLTAGRCDSLELSDEFITTFIGGRGFGAKLVWDNLVQHNFAVDPLGPENLLAIAAGPLTGTYLPSSSKCSFVSISPATKGYGDSSVGGSFGVELRQTGVDVLSITGCAPELSILFIDDDEASIMAMPKLAGKSCLETEGMIKDRLGYAAKLRAKRRLKQLEAEYSKENSK